MRQILEKMADPAFRERLGRRFEKLADEVFHVIRWAMIVGFVQFLEYRHPGPGFTVLRWILSVFLFGYIASRFLLRPELRFVPDDAGPAARAAQTLANIILCIVAAAAVLWIVGRFAEAVANYRFGS
ncbi:MAG: hypothetical protein D6688_11780 [Alphaproteobacteria bacterium]|nr:MAG: hypothetical protein D6688_11780 [Alphaproteobacteria bacterium]